MFDLIVASFAILTLYKGVNFYLDRKTISKYKNKLKGAEPIILRTNKNKPAILLIHGFTSTPWDVKNLANHLYKKGYNVFAPLLPGHGTSPVDLEQTSYHDWIRYVEDQLKKLKQDYKKVFIGGMSAGGNISLIIASKNDVDGVISMAVPIRFRRQRLLKMIWLVLKRLKRYKKKGGFKKSELSVIKNKVHYEDIPLKKLKDILILIKKTKEVLPKINIPILVMQSSTDNLLDNSNAEYIYQNVSSKKKSLIYIPDSYHVFLNDKNKETALKEVENFIKSCGKKIEKRYN